MEEISGLDDESLADFMADNSPPPAAASLEDGEVFEEGEQPDRMAGDLHDGSSSSSSVADESEQSDRLAGDEGSSSPSSVVDEGKQPGQMTGGLLEESSQPSPAVSDASSLRSTPEEEAPADSAVLQVCSRACGSCTF